MNVPACQLYVVFRNPVRPIISPHLLTYFLKLPVRVYLSTAQAVHYSTGVLIRPERTTKHQQATVAILLYNEMLERFERARCAFRTYYIDDLPFFFDSYHCGNFSTSIYHPSTQVISVWIVFGPPIALRYVSIVGCSRVYDLKGLY